MIELRCATRDDLPFILELLADDFLGSARESFSGHVDQRYIDAFEAIAVEASSELLVAERDDVIVGCLQLTMIPGLSHLGARRAQIESVRIAGPKRGKGLGSAMIRAALARAKSKGAAFAQLTSDVRRTDARRFYEKLGFSASHVGFKIEL